MMVRIPRHNMAKENKKSKERLIKPCYTPYLRAITVKDYNSNEDFSASLKADLMNNVGTFQSTR